MPSTDNQTEYSTKKFHSELCGVFGHPKDSVKRIKYERYKQMKMTTRWHSRTHIDVYVRDYLSASVEQKISSWIQFFCFRNLTFLSVSIFGRMKWLNESFFFHFWLKHCRHRQLKAMTSAVTKKRETEREKTRVCDSRKHSSDSVFPYELFSSAFLLLFYCRQFIGISDTISFLPLSLLSRFQSNVKAHMTT